MSRTHIAVLVSWLVSATLIGHAIFSTPYMKMVLRGEAVESATECIVAFIVFAVVCGWPWLKSLKASPSPSTTRFRFTFAVVAVGLSAAFYNPIATGHDLSVGLNTIFALLSIWLAYPAIRFVTRDA